MPGQGGRAAGCLLSERLLPVPPAQLLWGWFAAPEGAPGCRFLAPVDRSPGESQDPGWSAIFPLSEPLRPGVWRLVASGAGGRIINYFPLPPPLKQTQKGRSGASGFEVQRTTRSGVGMQSRRHGEAGLVLRGREPAPTACTGCGGRAGLPAGTESWPLRVTGVRLLPHP